MPADDEASFLFREAGNRGLAFVYVVLNAEKAVDQLLQHRASQWNFSYQEDLTKVVPVTVGMCLIDWLID